jgi:predicted porin
MKPCIPALALAAALAPLLVHADTTTSAVQLYGRLASYSSYKVSDTPGARANVVALGYTYALSKRTTLYTAYGRMNNDSASNFALWPSSKTYGLPGLGEDVRSVELGIRHFF